MTTPRGAATRSVAAGRPGPVLPLAAGTSCTNPAADNPLWQNPDLKTRQAIQSGGGLFDSITFPATNTYLQLMASNGIPVSTDFVIGRHAWHTWRQSLHAFVATLAFRRTTTTASTPETATHDHPVMFTASVVNDTTEPAGPTGSVNFYLDGVIDGAHLLGTAAVRAGTARITLPSQSGIDPGPHTVSAVYSGDQLYNTSTSNATDFTVTEVH